MAALPIIVLLGLLAGLTLIGLLFASAEAGERKVPNSADKVKATATATKPDADGKQTVTITLEIEKGWCIYANPVNHNHEFLDPYRVRVKIKAMNKIKGDVKYPAGTTRRDGDERFNIHEGVVTFRADVIRAKNDVSPLEITINVQGYSAEV